MVREAHKLGHRPVVNPWHLQLRLAVEWAPNEGRTDVARPRPQESLMGIIWEPRAGEPRLLWGMGVYVKVTGLQMKHTEGLRASS